MENYIKLSTLNDFIFCPKSIYYHTLYDSYDKNIYQEKAQKEGTKVHEAVDNQTYSTRKGILQGMSVFSEAYGLAGKIDIFNRSTGELTERKTQIFLDSTWVEKIYLWQRYQLWWQMFCLEEMGYSVKKMYIYSVKTNKKYRIYKPSSKQLSDFRKTLDEYKKFDLLQKNWKQNSKKCIRCIYRELCDYYIGEVYPQLKLF